MHSKGARSIFSLVILVLIISLACGGTASVVTPTITPTRTLPRLAPTFTPLATYTPRPTPTRYPTATPFPTITSIFQPEPSATVISGTLPVNCVPSKTGGYNTCIDNSGSLQVDIPNTWKDINGGAWTYKGTNIGVAISAAPDLKDFANNLKSEGVFFGASPTFAQVIGHIELLDFYTVAYRENCTYISRTNYNDGIYRGKYDTYTDCGGIGGYDAYILGAREIKEPSTKLILIEIQALPGDTSKRNQIWGTFLVP